MSVLERYKKRSVYKKSEAGPLSPIETNIYQPFPPLEPSRPFDSSAQADAATPVPQLSFTDDPTSSISGDRLATSVAPEASTALIAQAIPNDQVALPVQTDAKPLREPTRIRGTGKKSSGTMFAPKVRGKRTLTHAAMIALAFLVILGVLALLVPPASDGRAQGGNRLIDTLMHWTQGKGGNTALIASQIATATAVTQDGFDPGGGQTYPGVISSNGSSSASDAGNLNRFFYGQCTYWANMRYHQLTGHWVPWLGNAAQWSYQAAAYGWVVSSTPHVPSIMVLQPYVQGAGAYGHVAIVESINGNDITTSNWNVGGAWATTTYVINHPGPGVSFVSFPGA
jgi:surface antigen